MNEEISNGAALAIATSVAACILSILALLYDADQDDESAAQEIKAGTCPIQVTTPCGEDVCEYTAKVPCDELEKLIKEAGREP